MKFYIFRLTMVFLVTFLLNCSFVFSQEKSNFTLIKIISDENIMEREVFSPYIVSISGLSYPIIFMEDILAREKMTQDEFAQIIANRLVALSKVNSIEFCSQFCESSLGMYGARITTIKSRLFCSVVNVCPENMSKVGQDSIHNHIEGGSYKQTKIDKALSSVTNISTINYLRIGQAADNFSDRDFEQPGYMISMITYDLKYQSKGVIRFVGNLVK